MKRIPRLLFVSCLIASTQAIAFQPAPGSGSVHVSYLYPRNYGETLNSGTTNQGFYFLVDATITGISCAGGGTSLFVIPKTDPSNSMQDNPAYRDYVNAVMLAYTLGKPIVMYVDGCINYGYTPRVVGLDVWP